MIYEKCLIPVKARSITQKTVVFQVSGIINATTDKTVMIHVRGQNIFFPKCITFYVHLLLCDWIFLNIKDSDCKTCY